MRHLLFHTVCALVTVLTIGVGTPSINAAHKSPPNVLLIMVDNMGWSDLGCYGSEIDTPHLSRLAEPGHLIEVMATYPAEFNGQTLNPLRKKPAPHSRRRATRSRRPHAEDVGSVGEAGRRQQETGGKTWKEKEDEEENVMRKRVSTIRSDGNHTIGSGMLQVQFTIHSSLPFEEKVSDTR